MRFVVQGTVQVNRPAKGQATLFIKPISDYWVVHNTKEYMVLVEGERAEGIPQARMFPLDRAFKIDDSLRDTLVRAAVGATRIQLEIDVKDVKGKEAEVVGVQIPATAQSRPL